MILPVLPNKATILASAAGTAPASIASDLGSCQKLWTSCGGTFASVAATGLMNDHSPPCRDRSLEGEVVQSIYRLLDGESKSVVDVIPSAFIS